jgi:hypothetical protein
VRRRSLVALALVALAAGALPGADEPRAPRIRVEPDAFDFGRAQPGKTLRKEFTIRNFGDAELLIEGVSTTCGCTAALAAERRLAPGGSAALRVTLETRRYSGRLERQVLVRSNDPKTPLLQIRVGVTVEAAKAP